MEEKVPHLIHPLNTLKLFLDVIVNLSHRNITHTNKTITQKLAKNLIIITQASAVYIKLPYI